MDIITNSMKINVMFDASRCPSPSSHAPPQYQKNAPELDKTDRDNNLHTIRADTRPAQPKQLASDLNWKHLLVRQNMRNIWARHLRWISHDTRGRMTVLP